LSGRRNYQAIGNTFKAVAAPAKNWEKGLGKWRGGGPYRVAALHVLDGGGLGPGTMQCMGDRDGGVGGQCLIWKRCLMTGGWHRVQC